MEAVSGHQAACHLVDSETCPEGERAAL